MQKISALLLFFYCVGSIKATPPDNTPSFASQLEQTGSTIEGRYELNPHILSETNTSDIYINWFELNKYLNPQHAIITEKFNIQLRIPHSKWREIKYSQIAGKVLFSILYIGGAIGTSLIHMILHENTDSYEQQYGKIVSYILKNAHDRNVNDTLIASLFISGCLIVHNFAHTPKSAIRRISSFGDHVVIEIPLLDKKIRDMQEKFPSLNRWIKSDNGIPQILDTPRLPKN